ncbi:hypothetical protein BABINDRAFT_159777 [Babjeviella inositovora NRRL Y-12698]|uniref:Mitochondrial outer membrane transport complex Sam37/metaxin N-terminal domain-containing protein n=1 Tax=Babjeviella inositovora NRRL Y-12698 TaxID=984486 RepID=A0A1E3QWX3_9ASCO|nr:uncharacterized protein BABINDRAFT_159777 [Babjeviella inositovora NRRL Y-12698]ODQ81497.1 hypothetical protein BABINDRAFT_159777 [Babjeviella inositovora NRRL Y-12698]
MLELHVWGDDSISPISPESLASAYFLASHLAPAQFSIVTSSNTNLSPTGQLPVLRDDKRIVDGYTDIVAYVTQHYSADARIAELTGEATLLNDGVIAYIRDKLQYITQFVLYIDSNNYTNFTRPLFQRYLPFPMMYNQPLKFYDAAEEACESIGLKVPNAGFLSHIGFVGDAREEDMREADVGADDVALSQLHATQMLKRKEEKSVLANTAQMLRCLRFFKEYMDDIVLILGAEKYAFGDKISTCEILLYAHLECMSFPGLPNQAVGTYFEEKYPELHQRFVVVKTELDARLRAVVVERASDEDAPTLVNEVRFVAGRLFTKPSARNEVVL